MTHQTIAAVTEDLDRFHFNRAVARMRELTNAVEDDGRKPRRAVVLREAIETAVRLLGTDDAASRRGIVAGAGA